MGVGLKLPAAWRKSMIAGLLSGERPDGSFGVHPYSKWKGSHWRLVSLTELGVPRSSPAARAAADDVSHPEWLHIHWPHYWHYDFFQGLRVITMLGGSDDSRASEARQRLLDLRAPDGTWRADGRRYWRPTTEAVDWGDAHQVVTPVALGLLS